MAGKLSRDALERVVLRGLSPGADVLWGPQAGGDFAAVALDEKRALVTACDPLAVSPELGWDRSGWLAFHLVAVDVALSGIAPSYVTPGWTLPESISDQALHEVLQAFQREAQQFGVEVLAGHTGRYTESTYPWVGAATAMGIGPRAALRLPTAAQTGDALLLWGKPGLEAAVLLALPRTESVAPEIERWAEAEFHSLSALSIALDAAHVDGLRCMHDITEGGVVGAAAELSSAMGRGLMLHTDAIGADPQIQAVLQARGLSPLSVTSCGAVLAVASPAAAERLVSKGFQFVGEVRADGELLERVQGYTRPLIPPEHDPFWDVYTEQLSEKEGQ
ncbi:MAG: AIR synthase-related protein [Candidatus Bipolaricaulota bacterium]